MNHSSNAVDQDALPPIPQLDPAQIQMLRGLRNGQLLPQLMRTYRDQSPVTLREMQQALLQKNITELGTLAHTLKSASYSVGALYCGDACGELEAAARQPQIDQCAHWLQILIERYDLLQPELEQLLT